MTSEDVFTNALSLESFGNQLKMFPLSVLLMEALDIMEVRVNTVNISGEASKQNHLTHWDHFPRMLHEGRPHLGSNTYERQPAPKFLQQMLHEGRHLFDNRPGNENFK
jgi:hypothetical protein